MVSNKRTGAATLAALPVGTKFRLYAKYRDGSPRPRFRYGPAKGGRYLAGETLTVVRHAGYHTSVGGDCVIVSAGKVEVPLWGGMRVML